MLVQVVAERLYAALLATYSPAPRPLWQRLAQPILHRLRGALLRVADPVVTVRVHALPLHMRFSHPNPLYAAVAPFYDTALPRLCSFVRERQGWLQLVDVGANVGDTIAAVDAAVPDGSYLCVEPNADNVALLHDNTRAMRSRGVRVVCEEVLCGETTGAVAGVLVENRGNSFLEHRASDATDSLTDSLPVARLDDLVARNAGFERINVLKIDTEGYDFQVLRGAPRLVSEQKPALFFEFIPELMRSMGDEPLAMFDFLAAQGYATALAYDNKGIPRKVVRTSSDAAWRAEIEALLAQIDGTMIYYFDFLAMHETQNDDFERFVADEFRAVR
jgi:FkbM family methyltransferase